MAGTDGNFAAILHDRAMGRAAGRFLVDPASAATDQTASTYGDIDDLAARMATALAETGAEPGDRILVQVAKSPFAVALYLACLRGGFVHVPINPSCTTDEVGDYARNADPSILVTDPTFVTDVASLEAVPALLTLAGAGTGTIVERAAGARPSGIVARRGDDLAALLYTSGTTGRPKGAMLTHDNLRHNAEALHRIWRFDADDVLLHILPIFHVHGLFVALHCAMLSAVPIWFVPRFDAEAAVDLLPRSTVLMGVPTHYVRMLDRPELSASTCTNMRLFTSGSAPMTESTFDQFAARTGHRICERYGMSEAGIITSNPYEGDRIAGTVGHPLPGVELRIDGGAEPAPIDTTGVVEVRGPSLFAGYWERPEATDDAHRDDGWFVTGDVGRVDADGRLTLEGRAGDMIISGGENVYPKEIELLLDTIDGVTESAVIGVPHPDLGEAVLALVVTDDGTEIDDATIEALLDRSLARFKHPKAVLRVDALPRNTMGKVQKHTLRQTWMSLFSSD